jgi:hypothetical protein
VIWWHFSGPLSIYTPVKHFTFFGAKRPFLRDFAPNHNVTTIQNCTQYLLSRSGYPWLKLLLLLKGQSHEKVSVVRVGDVSLGPNYCKSSYEFFFNFLIGPYFKFVFHLLNLVLILNDAATLRIPICGSADSGPIVLDLQSNSQSEFSKLKGLVHRIPMFPLANSRILDYS